MRDPRYDEVFKLVLGDNESKSRTISFLNAVLKSKGEGDEIRKINFLPPTVKVGNDRTRHFDIKIECDCETYKGNRFIVEMQKASNSSSNSYSHVNRWIYYSALELHNISSNLTKLADDSPTKEEMADIKNFHFAYLKPVKLITIMDYTDPAVDDGNIVINWKIINEFNNKVGTNLLSWTFVSLPKFTSLIVESNKYEASDPLHRWLYFLTRRDNETVNLDSKLTHGDKDIESAYNRVSRLSTKELSKLEEEIRLRIEYCYEVIRDKTEAKAEGLVEGEAIGVA